MARLRSARRGRWDEHQRLLAQQRAATERLRAARNVGAQERLAAPEAENRELKERRKAGESRPPSPPSLTCERAVRAKCMYDLVKS